MLDIGLYIREIQELLKVTCIFPPHLCRCTGELEEQGARSRGVTPILQQLVHRTTPRQGETHGCQGGEVLLGLCLGGHSTAPAGNQSTVGNHHLIDQLGMFLISFHEVTKRCNQTLISWETTVTLW